LACFFEQEIEQNRCLAHNFSWQTDSLPLGWRFLHGRNSAPQCSHVFTAEQDLTDFQGACFCPASVGEESVIGSAGDASSIRDLNVYKLGDRFGSDRKDASWTHGGFHNVSRTNGFDGNRSAGRGDWSTGDNTLVHDHQVEGIELAGPLVDALDPGDDHRVLRVATLQAR
jgi:hypothetical protein